MYEQLTFICPQYVIVQNHFFYQLGAVVSSLFAASFLEPSLVPKVVFTQNPSTLIWTSFPQTKKKHNNSYCNGQLTCMRVDSYIPTEAD